MQDTELQRHLLRLFERHDVELEADEGWLVTDGDFPAVRASWHEGAAGEPGRLDVDIVLSEERHIEESFAGRDGARDALEAFERGMFHVALAACWYVTDERHMQLFGWELGVRTWDVFVAPALSSRTDVAAPDELLPALRSVLQDEPLRGELHWVRWFHRRDEQGRVSMEARLDNESWAAGDRWLASLAWPAVAGAYNLRGFVALDIRDY